MSGPTPDEVVAALRASLSDVERLEQENERLVRERQEPIAIVGMGCRFPGAVRSPAELWELLIHGRDAISSFPRDRGWDLRALYDPDPHHPGTSYVREGGFVHDAPDFDAAFFGISPREALAMDPQQRLLLEVCWEALEDAHLNPLSLKGSPTGVFAGLSMQDYLHPGDGLPAELEGHGLTGAAASVASGRLAYTLGLQGPAMTLDTACSSSLVAVHLACNALRGGECSLAVAGGATVMGTPGLFTEFSRQRGLAPDGRCKAFSDEADGTGLSEGAGVVVLERLSDALRNTRRILAVIRGSAVNQDGASNGLSAPNGPAQQRVILQALANAGSSPEEVDVVEAHGTGTTLGDPIEAQALLATYGARSAERPLWVGSVKSNLGHTQAAAGVAGLIKMVLALRYELLPKTLHAERPSSRVDWSAGAVSLLTDSIPWDSRTPRRAGVSSFGISGTNAHLILEQAPVRDARPRSRPAFPGEEAPAPLFEGPSATERPSAAEGPSPPTAWGLSGSGVAALRAQARRLHERVTSTAQLDPTEVARSLTHKPVLSNRALVLGHTRCELLEGLDCLARGGRAANLIQAAPLQGTSGTVWLFPGQGSQWEGMAVDLLDRSPLFRQSMIECQEALAPYVDWSLEEVLRERASGGMERVDVVQPALFAVMVSLASLWRAAGVRPSAVVGHSQGEIAAAYVAGGLSLADAARIVALRSKSLTVLSGRGAMASLSIGERELGDLLVDDPSLAVAAVNGPSSLVVSGEGQAVERLLARCAERNVRARSIPVDYAAHSPAVESIRGQLLDACAPVVPRTGEVPFYSTVTGGELDTRQLDAEYWYRNLRDTVQLESVTRLLLEREHDVFVELSPHPVLTVAVQDTAERVLDGSRGVLAVGSLRRQQPGRESLLAAWGEVWTHGVGVDWQAILSADDIVPVELPTYAFQRERYWLERTGGSTDLKGVGLLGAGHPLLGAAVWVADGDGLLLTGSLSSQTHGWLSEHRVLGSALLPGSAFVELALHAAALCGCDVVEELTLETPLVLHEGDPIAIQVSVGPDDGSGSRRLAIHSRPQSLFEDGEEGELSPTGWMRNASGMLRVSEPVASQLADASWPVAGAVELSLEGLYERLAEIDFDYGESFRGLRAVWRREGELFAEVELPESQRAEAKRYGLHPALLDAALHAPLAAALADLSCGDHDGVDGDGDGGHGDSADAGQGVMRLPFAWREVRLQASGCAAVRVHVRESPDGSLALTLSDSGGVTIATVGSLTARAPSRDHLDSYARGVSRSLFHIAWREVGSRDTGAGLASAEHPAAALALLGSAPDWIGAGDDDAPPPVAHVHSDVAALARSLEDGRASPAMAVCFCCREGGEGKREEDPIAAAHACVKRTLALLQEWLRTERLSELRLLLVTDNAVATSAGDGAVDPVAAAVWGLVRSAQAEHPGRFLLADTDRTAASWEALPRVLELDEPQLALRDGEPLAPRLVEALPTASSPAQLDGALGTRFAALGPGDCVLITGGTGLLGGLVARHLVVEHGVRNLLLTSRSGLAASGAGELHEELTALGASVTVAACDTSDRAALAELIDGVNRHGSLRAVVHAAGVLDEGILSTLSSEQVDRVLAPKVDAAWHLHELTENLDLEAFVLFSSAAGVFGAAGQANYAAANAFLDALASLRRARGLPGTSIAWGLWAPPSAMTEHLQRAHVRRIERAGLEVLQVEHGLQLFDAAPDRCSADRATAIAAPLDAPAARREARAGGLSPLLRELVRVSSAQRSPERTGALAAELAQLTPQERRRMLLDLVLREAAIVLGHTTPAAVESGRAFKELGFDSLLAVELRNRLSALIELRLPATLVFDHPTPQALAEHLLGALDGARHQAPARARRREAAAGEPIAIVGMACRFPGGVSTPEELWRLLSCAGDAISEFPEDRGWNLQELYDPDPDAVGKTYVREGGFLAEAGDFDAGFFGIGPNEALAMDPQQRLMLEACWEALESGWIDPLALRGSSTGVFAGVVNHAYAGSIGERIPDPVMGYLGVGGAASVVSGRVAYTLGLEGPALTVDTACSSSLVSVHLACQALRGGECELALAGGVTVLPTPAIFVDFSHQRNLARDGRCKAFAQAADGTSLGEGVGVLALERLSDALASDRRVLALIRGGAVNQDGRSNGLTAPNGPSQQRVIARALLDAGVAAEEVDAVEAHGTGTTLGDPIEAQALLATYGQRAAERPLWLGSIKSNIGHTQGAAGVAGLIKMVLALRHGVLPSTLHVDQPSHRVDWSAGAVALLTDPVPWERNGAPRRAGVSSFGISGTNAHLILEEAPVSEAPVREGHVSDAPLREDSLREPVNNGDRDEPAPTDEAPEAWVLSGTDERGLRAQAEKLLEHLDANGELPPRDVALSLAGKPALGERAALIGGTREELTRALKALSQGGPETGTARARARERGPLAFLFTGQGAQRLGMGVELHRTFPAFSDAFDEVCEQLDPLLALPLREAIGVRGDAGGGEPALLDRTAFAQPALFALEVALFRLLGSWGVRPSYLLGHSIGELVAAHVGGALPLQDACGLVAARGRLMDALPTGGAMVALEASEDEALALLAEAAEQMAEQRVALAAVNGPRSVVLSGDEAAVRTLADEWAGRGRKTRRLRVSHAFHSPHMDAMLEELTQVAAGMSVSPPAIPIVSNVTGEPVGEELCEPGYWATQARSTVRFAEGVGWLRAQGVDTFLELGPEGVLSAAVHDCLSLGEDGSRSPLAVSTMRANRPEATTLTACLAQAWAAGMEVDWSRMLRARGARRVALPGYAFQRKRYWMTHSMPPGSGPSSHGQAPAEHPLLAAAVPLAGGRGLLFTGRLSARTLPWLAEHTVMGTAVLPGAALLELALYAGAQAGCERVQELVLDAPLPIPAGAVQLQVTLGEPDAEGARPIEVHSRPEDGVDELLDGGEGWTRHAHGTMTTPRGAAAGDGLVHWPPAGSDPLAIDDLYETLADLGLDYGQSFHGLAAGWRRGEELYAEVALPPDPTLQPSAFAVHPALLDAALQVLAAHAQHEQGAWLPFSFSGVEVAVSGTSALRVRLSRIDEHSLAVTAADREGTPVLSIRSLQLRRVERAQLAGAATVAGDPLLTLGWQELDMPAVSTGSPRDWVVLQDAGGPSTPQLPLEALEGVERRNAASIVREAQDGGQPPPVAFAALPCGEWDDTSVVQGVHAGVLGTLGLLKRWLAAEPLAESLLVLLTTNAVPAGDETRPPTPAGAAAWGLARSAQSENPGRILLLDVDGEPSSFAALTAAVQMGLAREESQLALRDGRLLVPRLVSTESQSAPSAGDRDASVGPFDVSAGPFDAHGTVLVTGAMGAIGALVARHLVVEHGVRNLLLVGRGGSRSAAAQRLRAELRELGASVTIRRCDVSSRSELRALLASVPDERPLVGVVHAAGLLDDGAIGSLSAERVERVLAPKVDGAWHLHELTRELDLSAFVLFSSSAATLGGPGQGNYAAANAFMDALAARRRAEGHRATSIAWGLWSLEGGMAGSLDDSSSMRIAASGVRALSVEQGLELFDAACSAQAAAPLAISLDRPTLRAHAREGRLPAVLRSLVRVPTGARSGQLAGSLTGLAELPTAERHRRVLSFVLEQAAGVLGHELEQSASQQSFLELGFDSLSALELRNRLAAATQLRLSATLIFDYPTPRALAEHLLQALLDHAPATSARIAATSAPDEPLAIVGMSCRYPGAVRSAQELWELLCAGGDAISPFPRDRGWRTEEIYDPDPERPGTTYAREGGFLLDAGEFDASFFGIGAREALAMDPQQRLMLEASWEALEDAGIDPLSLRGTQTGVFAGAMYQDYAIGGERSLLEGLEGYLGTGNAGSVVSGRVAYAFGLEGPAVSVNTACSSSLVALHLACQALRAGECSLALAGGVTVMWTPVSFIEFSRQRGLSPDGRCRSYADGADGVGWSEGVGLVVLERLSDALRLDHEVLAVVRASAVNQDGASSGLTAPNGPSQQRVIAQALRNAGLEPWQIDAVEGHGTGTRLGDPIEAQALLATYGQRRSGRGPVWLGSVKSNLGHTQAAAGVAGVIKTVMALRHELLPRTIHVGEPSHEIDWSSGEVALLSEEVPWPRREQEPRRAAVSSFGISGTNAHVILEEAPVCEPSEPPRDPNESERESSEPPRDPSEPSHESLAQLPSGSSRGCAVVPWALCAKEEDALMEQAQRLAEHLRRSPELDPVDVGCSLARRAALEQRAVVLGGGREQLLGGLESLARGESPTSSVVMAPMGPQASAGGPLAFMFTGQGAQRVGMGAELYREFPVYARTFDEACGHLSEHLDRSLAEVVLGERSSAVDTSDPSGTPGETPGSLGLLDGTAYAQAGLFALEVALFRLLESFGVRPDFLIGHSIGEFSAAHLAGVFSLQDACSLVAARGRLMAELPSDGAMLAVQVPEQQARAALAGYEERVALAAVNGPEAIVISGEEQAVHELESRWREDGRKTKRLRVSHAFHSPHTDALLERFAEAVSGVSRSAPHTPVVSNLTGEAAAVEQICSVEYWVRHMRETVRFGDGVAWLYEQGVRGFLELGPDPVLGAIARESLGDAAHLTLSVLRAGRAEGETFARSLAELFVRGVEVDWGAAFAGRGARRVKLPTYPFQRRRYWLTPASGAGDARAIGQSPTGHPLLGASLELAGSGGAVFTGRLSLESHGWLGDHAVMGAVLLPASAFLDMALYAGGELGVGLVSELTLDEPLLLDERTAVRMQLTVSEPDEAGRRQLSIHSRDATDAQDGSDPGRWVRHATGTLASAGPDQGLTPVGLLPSDSGASGQPESWPPPGAERVELDDLYERVAERGLQYGPAFRCLKAAWRAREVVFAELALPEEQGLQADRFALHPGLLDAAFHAVLASHGQAAGEGGGSLSVPFQFANVALHASGASTLRVTLRSDDLESLSLLATDDTGLPVASIASLRGREISSEQLASRGRSRGVDVAREALFALRWIESPVVPDSGPSTTPATQQWALLGASSSSPSDSSAGNDSSVGGASSAGGDSSVGNEPSVAYERYADLGALVQALDRGAPAPDFVLLDCTSHPSGEDVVRSAHAAVGRTLGVLQGWLSEPRLSASRLVLLTRGAVAVQPGESVTGLPDSGIWGLVGSAQAENPGRFALVDHDGEGWSWEALTSALLSGESRLGVRGGRVLLARLQRAGDEGDAERDAFQPAQPHRDRPRAGFDPDGTVLITGGTGGLGALLAHHLVREHGVRSLLLASRSGPHADGAGALQDELTEFGATVRIVACDVSDRQALAALIASIDEQRPLRGVVHAAGVLDDGLIGSLADDRVDPVLAPKLDGAWHLHELTAERQLDAFVLFSSVAGALGSPGQGAYAAANAFLDALASRRRAAGLPCVSLAWGAWEEAGMAVRQPAGELHSSGRSGLRPLAVREALELFDRSLSLDRALLLPMRIDLRALRERASAGTLPALFAGLTAATRRASDASAGALRRRVQAAREDEREALVLRAVREQAAAILGHSSPEAIDPRRSFKDLGFDSLAAVELRNRLEFASGLRLQATVVFDYPDCGSLAAQLLEQFGDVSNGGSSGRFSGGSPGHPLEAELDALERMLSSLSSEDPQRLRVAERLGTIASGLAAVGARDAGSSASQEERSQIEQIEAASAEQIFELIDRQLASP